MSTVKDKLRQVLFVTIFGLVIPVALFFKAYPLGPKDMFGRIQFEWEQSKYPHTLDITLSNVFTPEDPIYLVGPMLIRDAQADTRVNLLVSENWGGYVYILEALNEAIKQTNAMVVVSVAKFGMSCGTLIVHSGNYLVLPNDSLLLFHLGRIGNKTISDFSTDPEIQAAAAYMHTLYKEYRAWLTDDEYQRFTHGEDIYVTGRSICESANGRGAPVLFTYKGGCVIKGVKK